MSATEIINGKHSVLELLRAGKRRCYEIWISESRKEGVVAELETEATKKRVPIRFVKKEILTSLAGVERHQGVVARVDVFPFETPENIVRVAKKDANKGFIVILDGILDPQNLGSLIRSANLMGVHGVILPKDNTAPVSSAVVKASAGATEYVPIAEVTNITSLLKGLKKEGFWIIGAEGETGKNVYSFDFKGDNYALVLGGEGRGIRRLVRETCDYLLSIPMIGQIESYNVSVAGAIFMAEVMRQRHFITIHKK